MASRMTIKIGDIVRLKSGGPDMTVEAQSELTGELVCAWFEGARKVRGAFPPQSLTKAK